MLEGSEVRVVAFGFFGQQRVQGVVKIVAPLGVEREAAAFRRIENFSVIQVAFTDEHHLSAQTFFELLHAFREFSEKMMRAEIADAVDGIEAQPIEAKLLEPIQCVGNEEIAHRAVVPAVKVQRGAPGSAIARGEVTAKLAEIISFGAEVIVDDIEND